MQIAVVQKRNQSHRMRGTLLKGRKHQLRRVQGARLGPNESNKSNQL